jgi:hypothetical protein
MMKGYEMTAEQTEVLEMINGFIADPPDSDYQRGYLAALLEVYRTVLRGPSTVEAAEKLTQAEE